MSNLYPQTSSDWAAWIQAFGSIAAIGASAWIAMWQSQKSTRQMLHQKEVDDEAKIDTFAEIVDAAIDRVGTVAMILHSDGTFIDKLQVLVPVHPEILDLEAALHRVELHMLPFGLVKYTLAVASTFTKFREMFDHVLAEGKRTSAEVLENKADEMLRMHAELRRARDFVDMRFIMTRSRSKGLTE